MLQSGIRTVVAMGAWGLLPRLTATRLSKRLAARAMGRPTYGWSYRLASNGIAVAATAVLAMVWLTPTMTAVRLRVALATLLHGLVGSKIEEGRLLEAYGEEYRSYMSEVPFFLPRLSLAGQR